VAGLNDEYLFRPYFRTLPRPPTPTPLFHFTPAPYSDPVISDPVISDPVISTPLFFWLEPFR